MEELEGEKVELRPRSRWWLYASLAMLLASAGLVVSLVLQRKSDSQQRDAANKVLPIVDTQYVACVLGAQVADAELGPKLLEAQMTGALTASKVRACGELAVQKLAPFEGLRHELQPRLDTFWDDGFIAEADDFGVCTRLELVRSSANDLGVAVPPPHCSVPLEKLESVMHGMRALTRLHDVRDEPVLDEYDMNQHVLRRSTDGKTWTTSEPVSSFRDLEVSSGGVWAYTEGHISVLDGDRWRQGVAFPKDAANVVAYRRTSTGWTMLWQLVGDDALVWRLDPTMSKVLAITPVPALHKRWTSDARPLGTITADGTVGVLLLRRTADAVEIEAHVVHPDGTVDAPRITRLPAHGTSSEVETCHAPGATYFAIEGAGTVATRDGGVTMTALRGGDAVFPAATACSDQQLIAAGNGHLMRCDQAECRNQVTPHRSGRTFTTRVTMHGESGRILVTDDYVASLFRLDPGGMVTFVRAWRWFGDEVPALVRADDAWFFID